MTIIKTWGGAGLATGPLTTSSAGTGDNPFDAVSSTLTVAADGIRSPCIGVPDGTGVLNATWNASATAWAYRVYVKLTSGTPLFCTAYTSTGSKIAQLDFNSSGKFRLTGIKAGASSVLWTSAAVPPTGSWYRVEVNYTNTTGVWNVAYYSGDSTTATDTGTGTQDASLTLASMAVGRNGSTSTGLVVDDIALGNTATFLGPATAVAPPTVNTHFVFNGTAWIPSTEHLIS